MPRSLLNRVLVAVGGLLIVGLALVVLYLFFGDLGRFRPQVESAVSSAVGREFRVAGEFRPKILPTPSLLATNVTLANASWGAPTPMVSVGSASVEIALWSLISGPIRIEALERRDVSVLLEQNESGEGNWPAQREAPPQPSASQPSAGFEIPVILERASLRNISLAVKRPGAEDLREDLETLEVQKEANGGFVAEAAGRYGERPFAVKATVAPPAAGGAPRRIDFDATLADASAHGSATVAPRQVDFDVSVDSLQRLAEVFAVPDLPAAGLQVAGRLLAGADGYELRETTAKLAGAEAKLAAKMGARPDSPLDIDVSLNAPALADIRPDLPKLAFAASAQARVAGDQIDVAPFDVKLGGSDFAGTLAVRLGSMLSLTLHGKSKLVDLTPLEPAPAGKPAAGGEKGAAKPPKGAARARKWVFGEEPLPFDRLGSTKIDAELAVAELKSRELQAQNVTLTLKGEGGKFDLKTAFEAQSGSANGEVVLAAAGDRADLNVDFAARDLLLNLMSGNADAAQVPPVGLSAKIRSSGNSPRALASAANGVVLFTQGPGRVANGAIDRVAGDVFAQLVHALNPFAKSDPYTDWDCSVVGLKIDAGKGVLRPMLAQGKKLQIIGSGTVDLHTEKLDVEFNTKPRSGVGVSADMFVTPFVKLGGTLAQPGVSMNAKGAMLTTGAAVLTGGLSVLARGIADRATAEHDRCPDALAEAGALAVVAN